MNKIAAWSFIATAALIVFLLLAVPLFADTAQLSQSTVTMRETSEPGAVAELFFDNTNHDSFAEDTFDLRLGDDACTVRMQVGRGDPDTIEPECAGLVAVPRILTIPDGTQGTILLVPMNYMGF